MASTTAIARETAATPSSQPLLAFGGRVLIAAIFVLSGISKIPHLPPASRTSRARACPCRNWRSPPPCWSNLGAASR